MDFESNSWVLKQFQVNLGIEQNLKKLNNTRRLKILENSKEFMGIDDYSFEYLYIF